MSFPGRRMLPAIAVAVILVVGLTGCSTGPRRASAAGTYVGGPSA